MSHHHHVKWHLENGDILLLNQEQQQYIYIISNIKVPIIKHSINTVSSTGSKILKHIIWNTLPRIQSAWSSLQFVFVLLDY